MDHKKFIERLGYLAARGLREGNHRMDVTAAYKAGFEAGVLAEQQPDDECPYDPDMKCSDHACDGC